jgi:hypothetical protein
VKYSFLSYPILFTSSRILSTKSIHSFGQ